MDPLEFLFGVVAVVALVAIAAWFGWRQFLLLRSVRAETTLSAEDRSYLHQQAWRRLFCCGLLILLACLLAGSFLLEPEYQRMVNDKSVLKSEQRSFYHRFAWYWIFPLFVLFLLFLLALRDLRATLQHGLKKHRRLRQNHRDTLESELKRLRKERNGK